MAQAAGGGPRILTVILHYGRPELTRRVHGQLLETDPGGAAHIRVLDNAAPEPYPDAWLRAEENGYWTGALLFCLEAAEQEGYSHLFFLNNDIYFTSKPPLLARIRGRLARIEATTRETHGPVGIYAPSAETNPYHPQMVARPGCQYARVGYVDGIAPLISLAAWRDVGLDTAGNPRGYGVDMAFSRSLVDAGYQLVVDQEVTLRHVYHSTARTISGFLEQAAREEQAYLARTLGPDYKALALAWQQATEYLASL